MRKRRDNGTKREKSQIPLPPDEWIRVEEPELRIIDVDLAERVDAVRGEKRERYFASLAKGGRVPERAHGKFLLSGPDVGVFGLQRELERLRARRCR